MGICADGKGGKRVEGATIENREEQKDAICNLAEDQDRSSSNSEGDALFIFESASMKAEDKNMQVIKA